MIVHHVEVAEIGKTRAVELGKFVVLEIHPREFGATFGVDVGYLVVLQIEAADILVC